MPKPALVAFRFLSRLRSGASRSTQHLLTKVTESNVAANIQAEAERSLTLWKPTQLLLSGETRFTRADVKRGGLYSSP